MFGRKVHSPFSFSCPLRERLFLYFFSSDLRFEVANLAQRLFIVLTIGRSINFLWSIRASALHYLIEQNYCFERTVSSSSKKSDIAMDATATVTATQVQPLSDRSTNTHLSDNNNHTCLKAPEGKIHSMEYHRQALQEKLKDAEKYVFRLGR